MQSLNFITANKDAPKFFESTPYSYLTHMGSRAYGTETPTSDYDFYGFIVPPAKIIFPHLTGKIHGFGKTYIHFEQYQKQHVKDDIYGEVDFTIYSIVKYFNLVMGGNPNMVDSLFADDSSVIFMDTVGEIVRNNRHLFLSEKMYHTFKGMAYIHASRLEKGNTKEGRKKFEEAFGWDVKDGYHTLRILLQIKEVLKTGDLHLKTNKDYLNDIRNGKYSLDYVLKQFSELMKELESIVKNGSAVPHSPNEKSIEDLLVSCLSLKYGNMNWFGFGILK